jgi:transposase-like protein
MTKHYPVEQRERAVKMVLDHLDEYRSVYAACQAIGPTASGTYRNWKSAAPSARTVTDAGLTDALRATIGTPQGHVPAAQDDSVFASPGPSGGGVHGAPANAR